MKSNSTESILYPAFWKILYAALQVTDAEIAAADLIPPTAESAVRTPV